MHKKDHKETHSEKHISMSQKSHTKKATAALKAKIGHKKGK